MQCPDFPGFPDFPDVQAVWDDVSAVTSVALQGAARFCLLLPAQVAV